MQPASRCGWSGKILEASRLRRLPPRPHSRRVRSGRRRASCGCDCRASRHGHQAPGVRPALSRRLMPPRSSTWPAMGEAGQVEVSARAAEAHWASRPSASASRPCRGQCLGQQLHRRRGSTHRIRRARMVNAGPARLRRGGRQPGPRAGPRNPPVVNQGAQRRGRRMCWAAATWPSITLRYPRAAASRAARPGIERERAAQDSGSDRRPALGPAPPAPGPVRTGRPTSPCRITGQRGEDRRAPRRALPEGPQRRPQHDQGVGRLPGASAQGPRARGPPRRRRRIGSRPIARATAWLDLGR